MFKKRNSRKSYIVAKYNTVTFEFEHDCLGYSHYIVQDTKKDVFEVVSFYASDTTQDRRAYEKAARIYNGLVPDMEYIPLF